MNRLAILYSEIERRLDEGESSSPELETLFTEVAQLVQTGEDVWFNLDPKGLSHFARLNAEFAGQNASSSGHAGWR